MNKSKNFLVKATGETIRAYKLNKNEKGKKETWCNFEDCKTTYCITELEIKN